MKKVEIFVNPGVRDKVVSAIKKVGVGGVSVISCQGQGAEEPPLVGSYYTKDLIVTVVDGTKVTEIMDAVVNIACTGSKGDGKIFVSSVEDALDICTKERGPQAI